ncbi:hypothetical protein BDF19DRAFT_28355 [Syncephalis fuscata]|nr:hypothetical protein BDF19DRAFT_28355 [Syncephalis fuscata]
MVLYTYYNYNTAIYILAIAYSLQYILFDPLVATFYSKLLSFLILAILLARFSLFRSFHLLSYM